MSAAEHTPHELQTYDPPADLKAHAWVSGMDAYNALCAEAEADHEAFWARQARELLSWKTPFTKVLNDGDAPFFKWFEDGTLNASYNCLDRQVEAGLGDKVALVFEADDGAVTRVTYKELLARTCRLANALKARGVKKGDRVVIYMSMSVEGVAAMQACARIGAPHSVVFGGFSAQSLRDRVEDTGAVMVITADEQARGGKSLPLKSIVDDAIALGGCDAVKDVIVYKRTGGAIAWTTRDHWLHEVTAAAADTCEPEWVGAEHPLFLLYTSGSTGKPRACSTPPAATCCTRRSPPSGRSTSRPTTSSGAPPTSAGSPAIPTSPTARWRSAAPRSCSRACPRTPTPAGSGR